MHDLARIQAAIDAAVVLSLAELGEGVAAAASPAPAPAAVAEQEVDGTLRAELELADRFVRQHQDDIRFCADLGCWYVWDGMVWRSEDPKAPALIMERAKETALAMARERIAEAVQASEELSEALTKATCSDPEKDPEVKRLRGEIRRCNRDAEGVQTLRKLEAMEHLARSDPRVQVRFVQLDADPYALNTPSGLVDLRTGRLRPHDRAAMATRITASEYEPGFTLDIFQKLLSTATGGDKELERYLHLCLGASMYGHNETERFYMALGPGGSGKGTLFEGLKACLGEYCATAEFQSFIKTQGGRVRDDLARLRSAHVVLASETEKGDTLAAATIKQITGGDTIAARELYGRYMEFRPRLTLWMQLNPPAPRVDDQDSGMWRRLVVVPFAHAIPEDQRDPAIKRRMNDPADGGRAMLAWLVAGAQQAYGLARIPMPNAVRAATNAYNEDMDPLREFLTDAVRFADKADLDQFRRTYVTQRGLREAYQGWYSESGGNPKYILGPKEFTRRLRNLDRVSGAVRQVGVKDHKCWLGLTLPEESEANYGSFRPSFAMHSKALVGYLATSLLDSGKVLCEKAQDGNGSHLAANALGNFQNDGKSGSQVAGADEWEAPF